MPDYPEVIIPVDKQPAVTKNADKTVRPEYILVALEHVRREANAIARKIADITKPVDEWSTQPLFDETQSTTTVSVVPQYDKSAERIECIIVTGPATTAFTLTLGNRSWSVLTDARGLFQLNGAGIMLDKHDLRQVVSSTAGDWTLELTGYADERYFTP